MAVTYGWAGGWWLRGGLRELAALCSRDAPLSHPRVFTTPQLVALLPRVDRSMASASRNIASYDLYECDEDTGRCSIASTAFGRKSGGSKDLQTYADVR